MNRQQVAMKRHISFSASNKRVNRGIRMIPGFVLIALATLAHAQNSEIRDIEDSVIKIYTTQAAPDYFTPWRLMTPRQSSGSGAVIAGNQILTNAHVVANASYVQAQKHNDPRRYGARVTFVSHEADLALITVDEPGFFSDLRALAIGELPDPLEEVSVYGYPIGGKSLSVTKGILSRVNSRSTPMPAPTCWPARSTRPSIPATAAGR